MIVLEWKYNAYMYLQGIFVSGIFFFSFLLKQLNSRAPSVCKQGIIIIVFDGPGPIRYDFGDFAFGESSINTWRVCKNVCKQLLN